MHSLILETIQKKDWQSLNAYARWSCLLLTTPSIKISGLSLLEMWSPYFDYSQSEIVVPVCQVLAQAQIRFPEEVDDFLRVHKHSQELTDLLNTTLAEVTVSDVFQLTIPNFFFDVTHSESLLDSMVLLLGQMPKVKNMREWLSILIGYILNLSFGKEVFRLKMWPVDVGVKVLENPFES